MRERRGVALALVLGLLVVLGAFGAVLRVLTQSASREVDVVNAHLQAIAVAEVGFASTVARLTGAPWSERWFRDAPDVQVDVPASGGTYTLLIRDTPQPAQYDDPLARAAFGSRNQADLLIRATVDRSAVVVFWRLTVPEDSLDALAVVLPTFFTFGPASAPVSPATADTLSGLVNTGVRERAQNAPRSDGLHGPLRQAPDPAAIGTLLGFTPPGPVLAGRPPDTDEGAPAPPAPPPLPPADLSGSWMSDVFPDIKGRLVQDYLVLTQVGNRVTGRCVCREVATGAVTATWELDTSFDGATLGFEAQNYRVDGVPLGSFRKDMRLQTGGDRLEGTMTTGGRVLTNSARYDRQL